MEYNGKLNKDTRILSKVHQIHTRRDIMPKLFCQLSPTAYKISVLKCRTIRHLKNILSYKKIAKSKQSTKLPYVIGSHKSLIQRKLGNVDLTLQANKANNLSIATPKVTNIIIKPGEIFSFWTLVGKCTTRKGYKEGMTICQGEPSKGVGGGVCQFTNLIHWLVLHTPLQIVEHHHHDGVDLFPDFGRQVPFGVGTSIMYNYLDYRFKNTTELTFQLVVWTDETHLCGELRANGKLDVKYHIKCENEFFSKEDGIVYRNSEIYRECIDVKSGCLKNRELLKTNHARVLYDTTNLVIKTETA